MGFFRRAACAWLLFLIGAQPIAWAAASDEAQVFHVARLHENADDTHKGTAQAPLATLGEAIRRALPQLAEGAAVQIEIGPGVYRERLEVVLPQLDADAPRGALTLRSEAPVILSGADIADDWTPASNYYLTPWPHATGAVTFPPEIEANYARDGQPIPWLIRQREMLFLRTENQPRAIRLPMVAPAQKIEKGTFTLFPDSGQIALFPPHNYRLGPGAVLISNPARSRLLHVSGLDRFSLQGPIEFRHAAGVLGDRPAAVEIENTRDVRIEGATFEHNNTYGLTVTACASVTLRDLKVQRNGLGGLIVKDSDTVTVDDCVVRLNDWRGFEAGITPVGAIGASFEGNANVSITESRFLDNKCDALHIANRDSPDESVNLADLSLINNGGHALYVFSDRATISDTVFALNAASTNLRGRIELVRCIFYDNGPASILQTEDLELPFAQLNCFGGGAQGDGVTATRITLADSILANRNAAPQVALLEWTAPISEATADTFTGRQNIYFTRGETPASFRVETHFTDLTQWRELVQSDITSIETDPLLSGAPRLDFVPHPTSPAYRKQRWPKSVLETAAGTAWLELQAVTAAE